MEWKELLQEFEQYLLLEKNLSDNSRLAYLRDLKKVQTQIEKSPIKIDSNDLIETLHSIQKEGISNRSQARLITSLKSFFLFLVINKYRSDNPAELLEQPKLGTYLPEVLSLDEINRIILAIDLSSKHGERNRTIIETLYGCGLRISELISLRLSDLFFDEGFVRVIGKANKERLTPLGSHTAKYLKIYLENIRPFGKIDTKHSDTVFLNNRGSGLSREMIFMLIKKLAKEAGIEKNVSPHTFRHSYATHMLQNGADLRSIQLMLGHESITTTEIYTHLDNNQLRETLLKHHPLNQSNNQ